MQTLRKRGVRTVQIATFALAAATLAGCSTVQTDRKSTRLNSSHRR